MTLKQRLYATVTLCILLTTLTLLLTWTPRSAHAQFTPQGYVYTHIGSATSTQVATIPMVLHTVVVNTAGTTATLYDNAGACSTTTIGAIGTATGTFTYDLQLLHGLCIVTTGSGDWTITTR